MAAWVRHLHGTHTFSTNFVDVILHDRQTPYPIAESSDLRSMIAQGRRSPLLFGLKFNMQPASSVSEPSHVQSRLLWWAKPSRQHDSADTLEVAKLAEVVKFYLRQRLEFFVRGLADKPLLLSGAADGTPLRTTQQIVHTRDGTSVRRTGKSAGEYYVQHLFACAMDSRGQLTSRVFIEEPRRMTRGKTALAELALVANILPDLRGLGHCWLTHIAAPSATTKPFTTNILQTAGGGRWSKTIKAGKQLAQQL